MIFSIAANGNSLSDINITYFSLFFDLKAIFSVVLELGRIYKGFGFEKLIIDFI